MLSIGLSLFLKTFSNHSADIQLKSSSNVVRKPFVRPTPQARLFIESKIIEFGFIVIYYPSVLGWHSICILFRPFQIPFRIFPAFWQALEPISYPPTVFVEPSFSFIFFQKNSSNVLLSLKPIP